MRPWDGSPSTLDTLRAGDESNAIVEAAGAVNLMTIHAAKGLEFPVVFVVNLHVGGRGRPGGFSVIDWGPDGTPEVAFNATAATRLEELREAEELRRLFYVAVTRARDRLYLAAEIDKKGKLRRSARSLAGLLPGGLAEIFTAAGLPADPEQSREDSDRVNWDTPHGSFAFRVCRCPTNVPSAALSAALPSSAATTARPLEPEARVVHAVTDAPPRAEAVPSRARSVMTRERLAGTIVHRLMQRGLPPELDATTLRTLVPTLLRSAEIRRRRRSRRAVGRRRRALWAVARTGGPHRAAASGPLPP